MFQKIFRKIFHIKSCLLRRRNIPKLKILSNSQSGSFISGIAKCIYACLSKQVFSTEEQNVLNKINLLREYYQNNNTLIEIQDFGAGNPDEERTIQEMEQGVQESSSISSVYIDCSSPEKWGELMFRLIREFKPNNCLELGTCLGISAAYQLSAMQLNGKGNLISIEGSESLGKIAKEKLSEFSTNNFKLLDGKFVDVLPDLLNENSEYDFVFIDGHHDKDATLNYLNMIYPKLSEKSIVVFDDINWSKGMKEFWKGVIKDSRIYMSFDLYKLGICYINKESFNKSTRNIKLCF